MTGPLDVLLLNDYGRPSGGAELQMLALRDGLRGRGHRVRLLTSDAVLVPGFELLADQACHGRTDRWQVLSQVVNRDAVRVLRRELLEHPPDIVHIRMFLWQLSPLVLPLLKDVPVLFQAAVYKAICPNGMKLWPNGRICDVPAGRVCLRTGCVAPATWLATMAQLALVRRWRHVIDLNATLSRRMAGIFAAEGWEDVRVLPNGIAEGAMRPALSGPPRVGYAGRLSPEKGVETLIDAFARIAPEAPEAELVIAGDGPSAAALRARAAPLGDRVRFLGHLPRDEMERRFAAIWVQAVPSLWHEPFGNVTTEAMMRGTAVVASDMGGQSDIVQDGRTGFLVPPGDPEALAGRLSLLLGDRARAEAMGRTGRAVALEDFSQERVLDRLEAAYAEARTRHAARRDSREVC